jgi:predicted DCC family thiol-disulfide oxidoreductase YuxK
MAVSAPVVTQRRSNKFTTAFIRLYNKQVDGAGLAIFRICFGLILLFEVVSLYRFRHIIFDVVPFLQPYDISFTAPLFIWMGAIGLLILGLWTRAAAFLNYLFCLLIFTATIEFTYLMYYVYMPVAVMFLFLPINRRLSLDRLLLKLKYSNTRFRYAPSRTVSQLSYYIPIIVGIGFVYFDSTLYKLASPMWLQGLGMWVPSSLPFVTRTTSTSFLLDIEALVKFMGWLSLVFEFLFLFLFPFRRYRAILGVIGIGLHMGILLEFPIPLFALGFSTLYLLMVPAAFWRWLAPRSLSEPKLTFYYDAECPLCARTRVIIEHFDVQRAVRFRSVQAYAHQEPALAGIPFDLLLDDIHSVDPQGRVYRGVATYVQVLSGIWYLRPLSWLLRMPGINWVAQRVYGIVARNRTTERCTEDNCGYIAPVVPPADDEFKILQNFTLKDLKIAGVAIGLAALVIAQIAISYNATLVVTARNKLGVDATLPGRILKNVTGHISVLSRRFLGLTYHNIFLDGHFSNYTRIVGVTYTAPGGKEQFLPIIQENGQPGSFLTGPLWCNWTWQAVGPYIDRQALDRGLLRYTAFWAGENGVSLKDCQFNVRVKKMDPINVTKWEPGFLNKQLQQPWQTVGTVVWHDDKYTSHIDASL